MRKINKIIIHCSDSDVKRHDNIQTIVSWHTQRGFTGPDGIHGTEDDIGYHYFIDKKGDVYPGRPEESIGAHTAGHNSGSLGVCLSGRRDFTTEQFRSLDRLADELCQKHGLKKSDVKGHNEFNKEKSCPNFDLRSEKEKWSWD